MIIKSKKLSGIDDLTISLNRSSLRELRSDLKRAKRVTIIGGVLTIVSHFVGIGFIEALICTILSTISAIGLNLFIQSSEKR